MASNLASDLLQAFDPKRNDARGGERPQGRGQVPAVRKVQGTPSQDLGTAAGLPDGFFQTKNPNLGKFCRVLQWKMLVYFIAVSSILRPFGIFCGHLVYFSCFGMLCQEKSGNPVANHC
jgi:hypothetical protein